MPHPLLHAPRLSALQDRATAFWHNDQLASPEPTSPFEQLVLDQHRANFDLWHQEDLARDPHAPDSTIAQVKHAIDRINQRRNDLVEQIDLALLQAASQLPSAPLHSETPGLIIDRLSILALKLFHTQEQAHRSDATEDHRLRNRERLHILLEQRMDLRDCLDALWTDIAAGNRRFKLYRQLKMYNDPTLNPVLYAGKPTSGASADPWPAASPQGAIDQKHT